MYVGAWHSICEAEKLAKAVSANTENNIYTRYVAVLSWIDISATKDRIEYRIKKALL